MTLILYTRFDDRYRRMEIQWLQDQREIKTH